MPLSHPHRKLSKTLILIADLISEIGATLWLEDEYEYVGYIQFQNGKRSFFYDGSVNPNSLGPLKIARDKGYSAMFLEQFGYQVPEGKNFYNDILNEKIDVKRDREDGWQYICSTLGLPVIVKPNNLSQGIGVRKVSTRDEYDEAMDIIFTQTNVARIERLYHGNDYRIVILDGELIAAYMRTPLSVIGDGASPVSRLIEHKQYILSENGRHVRIRPDDPRILSKIHEQGLTLESIIEKGRQIFILENANLSSGGDSLDLTESIHQDFVDLAIRITKDMGLRLCGVDIMTRDITLPLSDNPEYVIIEINGSPGMSHYSTLGEGPKDRIRSMYKKILLSLAEGI